MLKIKRTPYRFANILGVLTLLIIHFVVKEYNFLSALLYYMFPLPVLIAIILFLSFFLDKTFKKIYFLIAAILLFIWLGRSFKINLSETIKPNDLEVVFWNASRKRGFLDAFEQNKGVPDVLVIAEGLKNNLEALKRDYPDYHFYVFKKEIAIFSKTPISGIEKIIGSYGTTIIKFKVNTINFFAVDVSGSIDVPRKWSLDFINTHLENKKNKIILGDFNTPVESKFFKDIKTHFNHAFNQKGNGFRETWCWNIPLLSLDHIWVSKDLKIVKTQKLGTFKSDHSMLRTYIRK